jgi:hypothetical protein
LEEVLSVCLEMIAGVEAINSALVTMKSISFNETIEVIVGLLCAAYLIIKGLKKIVQGLKIFLQKLEALYQILRNPRQLFE